MYVSSYLKFNGNLSLEIAFSFSFDINKPREVTFCLSNYTVGYAKKALVGLTKILFSLNIENINLRYWTCSINIWEKMIMSSTYARTNFLLGHNSLSICCYTYATKFLYPITAILKYSWPQ